MSAAAENGEAHAALRAAHPVAEMVTGDFESDGRADQVKGRQGRGRSRGHHPRPLCAAPPLAAISRRGLECDPARPAGGEVRNRTIYIIVAVVIVLAIVGYAGGWFGGGTPVPATTPAPATGTTTQ